MALVPPLRFGTDGWRGIIARDVTFDRVRLAARAVGRTLRAADVGEERPLLAVGYDTRFLSARFARAAAEALCAEHVDVRLTTSFLPTPALAWSVTLLGAQGGIVITASHNPPSYNGLKVRAADGGPASPALIAQIEGEVERLASRPAVFDGPNRSTSVQDAPLGGIELFDPLPRYRQRLGSLVDLDRVACSRIHVVVDPMFGATRGLLAGLLRERGVEADEIHGEASLWFGGLPPEPLPESLGELAAWVKGLSAQSRVGVALDGDGDRLAAIDEGGSYVSPHQIFALLLRHLVTRRGFSGTVVKTFSTTMMIDRLAAGYGLRLAVTPIGFKYVAELIRRQPVLMGGEESGGIGVAGHIPERDGTLSALLLLECLAVEGKPLGALIDRLEAEVGPHRYRRVDLPLRGGWDRGELERRIVGRAPSSIDRCRIADVQCLDGVKMIGEDGSWLLIRRSGTEPVLRLYAEAPTDDQVSRMLDWATAYVRGLREDV
jgi:phosphomannomutase